MKTWNIPSVEELEVKLTAAGEDPFCCEIEYDGCIDISTHRCAEYDWCTGTCPHQSNGDGPVGDGES